MKFKLFLFSALLYNMANASAPAQAAAAAASNPQEALTTKERDDFAALRAIGFDTIMQFITKKHCDITNRDDLEDCRYLIEKMQIASTMIDRDHKSQADKESKHNTVSTSEPISETEPKPIPTSANRIRIEIFHLEDDLKRAKKRISQYTAKRNSDEARMAQLAAALTKINSKALEAATGERNPHAAAKTAS